MTTIAPPPPLVRRMPFEFDDDLQPHWHPDDIEWSHMVNGGSLTMPYLEPFLIATLRDAKADITDEALLAEIDGFVGQEAQHFRTHRRYNELLKAKGYADLAEAEADMKAAYQKLGERSLGYRLAYAAGFESMTMSLTRWLVENRVRLFAGSDTRVASFVLWHMVEEVEHKRVAFDAFMAVDGRYPLRALGVLVGTGHVFLLARRGCVEMLKSDGRWWNPRARLRLWAHTADFLRHALHGAARACRPGHDPRDDADPAWVTTWIERFEPGEGALIDTDDPEMPVPFPERAAA